MNIRQTFGWGANSAGQLGLPEKKPHVRPQLVPLPPSAGDVEVSAVACGSHHSVLLAGSSGEIYTVGSNEFGQLGHQDVGTGTQSSHACAE